MAIDKEILDEIEKLTADQLLQELRTAKANGTKLDPRTLKAAMELIERAMGKTKAFAPSEQVPTAVPRHVAAASEVGEEEEVQEVELLPEWAKTAKLRNKLRRAPFLSANDRRILNAYAEIDGAPLLTGDDDGQAVRAGD